jgi:hypothetical protein
LNVQKSAEAIVVERQRAESAGVPITTGKGGMAVDSRKLRKRRLPVEG